MSLSNSMKEMFLLKKPHFQRRVEQIIHINNTIKKREKKIDAGGINSSAYVRN